MAYTLASKRAFNCALLRSVQSSRQLYELPQTSIVTRWEPKIAVSLILFIPEMNGAYVHMSFLNDRSNSLKSHRDFINRMLNIPFNLCDIMEMHNTFIQTRCIIIKWKCDDHEKFTRCSHKRIWNFLFKGEIFIAMRTLKAA